MVLLTIEKGEPVVLSRERIHLVKTFNYSFRQPYHTAAKIPLDEGREFISRVKAESRNLAYRALRGIQAKLDEADYRLTHCGLLLASGRTLPDLETILAAHPLIHTADGELFREALSFASRKYGLKEFRIKERELFGSAAKLLRQREGALVQKVAEMGRALGSPWSQDEKYSALVAWLALRNREDRSPAG